MPDDALDALKQHNEQLSKLLTKDGLAELNRMALLEIAIHAYVDGRLSKFSEMPENILRDRLLTELSETGATLSPDIVAFINMPDSVKDVGKKIGSVANSYVKKKTGGILGGNDDDSQSEE